MIVDLPNTMHGSRRHIKLFKLDDKKFDPVLSTRSQLPPSLFRTHTTQRRRNIVKGSTRQPHIEDLKMFLASTVFVLAIAGLIAATTNHEYDYVIVGSGPGGGSLASVLQLFQ